MLNFALSKKLIARIPKAMKRFVVILYFCMIALLGVTTIIEHSEGAAFVADHVYHTAWFCAAWAVLALLLVMAVVKSALWRRVPVVMLHASFLVILLGAAITFGTSEKGFVHLLPNQSVAAFTDDDRTTLHELPFTLTLDSFAVRCYPGTDAPADYVSHISITDGKRREKVAVSMNNIYTHRGYRLYQSSYDDDGSGSWLSVNYDPWGTGVSYVGYLLLALSMCGTLAARREEFRRLLHHPLLRKSALLVALLACAAQASARTTLPAFNRAKADSLASRQVIYNDRVVPFNTLARDFVVKLTGSASFHGLSAEQVVSGWLLRPDAWQHEPMILVKNAELRHALGIDGRYARFTDFFNGGDYVLMRYLKGTGSMMPSSAPQSALQKAAEEADEKVGLILMLTNGTLIRPLPKDGSVQQLSPVRVEAELLYNRLPLTKVLFMANLTLGLLAFGLLLYRITRTSNLSEKVRRRISIADRCLRVALWASLALMALTYGLRWYVAGRVPLANGYETMLFLALGTLLVAGLMHRRFAVALPFGFLLSGFALLVSHLGQMNPQITPLVPVLVSPWLSLHVSLVMLSYALLAFVMLNGITALCLPREGERLMLISRLLLYPATFLLGIGIFMGAVWANQSWGSYWSWDPKETWALITFMLYGVAFHPQSLPWLRRPRAFHLYVVLAFLAVVMTYVGVNYFLTGMHSYA